MDKTNGATHPANACKFKVDMTVMQDQLFSLTAKNTLLINGPTLLEEFTIQDTQREMEEDSKSRPR